MSAPRVRKLRPLYQESSRTRRAKQATLARRHARRMRGRAGR